MHRRATRHSWHPRISTIPDPLIHTVSAHFDDVSLYLLIVVVAGVASPRPSNNTVVGELLMAESVVPYALLNMMGPRSVTVVPLVLLVTVTLAEAAVSVSVATRPFCMAAARAAENVDVNSCRDARNALFALISEIMGEMRKKTIERIAMTMSNSTIVKPRRAL